MFTRLLASIVLLSACAPPPPAAQLQSYQSRNDASYTYILSHTAALQGQAPHAAVNDAVIPRAEFANYGSCFYRVVSPTKLRLHRQDDLQQALTAATPVSSNYIPLDVLWQQFRQDSSLQELYTSSRHWFYRVMGGAGALMIIGTIDSFLHHGNGIVVENAHEHIIKSFQKGDRSLRRQTLEALHLVASVEHASDELTRNAMTIGKRNPLKHLNRVLMDNRVSRSIATLFKKNCIGKARATTCLVTYLAAFNGMFILGIPFGGEWLAAKMARWRNRESEDSTLTDLLGDRYSLTNTHISSEKTFRAIEKVAALMPADTPTCPAAPTLLPQP